MITILINAYAVSPNHGSEPGVGWNWVIEIAKYCTVHVITESEFKDDIKEALKELPQKDNIRFYFNDIGEKARKMCWNQGDYRFYYYYRKWQQKTLIIAKDIISNNEIDIIHHLNMIGYREPGYLWKIENIPYVWGPIGGFNFVKLSFLKSLGIKKGVLYAIKNILNRIQALTNLRVIKAIKRSDLLLAASGNTKKAIKIFYNKESIIVNETGCHIVNNVNNSNLLNKDEFKILWVGRFIPTKMLYLALDTIQKVRKLSNIKLHIVGSGVNDTITNKYKEYAKDIGVENSCIWHDHISREEVDKIMNNSDLFFFTSIVEATSTVVMEAISNHLPILCFDTSGHGEIVTKDIGRKVKLETPQRGITAFAKEIEFLCLNREVLVEMSANCEFKIKTLSWETKGAKMYQLYKMILNQKVSNK